MNCTSVIPNGSARSACLLDQPTNLIFLVKGTRFTNYDDIKSIESHRVKIQDSLIEYPTLDIRTAASTKPAPVKETDGAGVNITTRIDAGGVVVNLKTNACDFKEMLATMKGDYDVIIGLGSNKMMVQTFQNGELGGFEGQCVAVPVGMPSQDAKIEEFQIDINWNNVAQWENYKVITLPFFLKELVELTPTGLDYSVKTKLSSSTESALIQERCGGDAVTDTLTFVVTDHNVVTPAVTPVAASGLYTVTVEQGAAPAALTAGQFITGYFVEMSTAIHLQISNTVTFKLDT